MTVQDDSLQWARDGWIGPFPALSADTAAAFASAFDLAFAAAADRRTMNRHCDLPEVARIVREAAVWDRLAQALGPGLVLWRSNLFLGNPRLDWHEDRHANLLGGAPSVSALLALRDSPADNCTLAVPGSHLLDPDAKAARYGLQRNDQEGGNIRYAGRLDEDQFVRLALRAGECIVFPPSLLHASSGYVGRAAPATPRLSLVLRVTTTAADISPQAYAPTLPRESWPVLMRGTGGHAAAAYGRLAS